MKDLAKEMGAKLYVENDEAGPASCSSK